MLLTRTIGLAWRARSASRPQPLAVEPDDVSWNFVADAGTGAVGWIARRTWGRRRRFGCLPVSRPDYTFSLFGTDPVPAKSVVATIALGLAGVQVLLALWLYRRLPLTPRRLVRPAHRVTGAILVALTVPVALHCLIAYGVQLTSPRVAVHLVAGCFFYGAFAAKALAVHSRRLPGWTLPMVGGTLAVVIAVLWYTSALWYYNGYQLPHL